MTEIEEADMLTRVYRSVHLRIETLVNEWLPQTLTRGKKKFHMVNVIKKWDNNPYMGNGFAKYNYKEWFEEHLNLITTWLDPGETTIACESADGGILSYLSLNQFNEYRDFKKWRKKHDQIRRSKTDR